MDNPFRAPNWNDWLNRDLVGLYDASVLSFGICPVSAREVYSEEDPSWYDDEELYARSKEINLRAEFALTEIKSGSAFASIVYGGTCENPDRYPKIALKDFRNWAENKKLKVHPAFIASLSNLRPEDLSRGINLIIPYESEFMSIIAKIMWEHYDMKEQKTTALQKNIADQISNETGIEKRSGVSIAAKIRPIGLSKKSVIPLKKRDTLKNI